MTQTLAETDEAGLRGKVAGDTGVAYAADVTDETQCQAMVAAAAVWLTNPLPHGGEAYMDPPGVAREIFYGMSQRMNDCMHISGLFNGAGWGSWS